MDSFFSNIVSSLIASLLLAGGAVMLPILKIKWPQYVEHVRYGMIGLACTAILIVSFTGRPLFSEKPFHITSDNVEENIKLWAEKAGLGIAKPNVPHDNGTFNYTIALTSGLPVTVFRNQNSKFVEMQTMAQVSPDDQQIINAMSADESTDLIQTTRAELGEAKIANLYNTPTPHFQITLRKVMFINSLDEGAFMQGLDEMDYGFAIVESELSKAVRHKKREMGGQKQGEPEHKPDRP